MRTHLREDGIKWLAILIAVLLIVDLWMDKPGYLPWERWFASYALLALLAAAVLGLIGPAVGRALMRRENEDG